MDHDALPVLRPKRLSFAFRTLSCAALRARSFDGFLADAARSGDVQRSGNWELEHRALWGSYRSFGEFVNSGAETFAHVQVVGRQAAVDRPTSSLSALLSLLRGRPHAGSTVTRCRLVGGCVQHRTMISLGADAVSANFDLWARRAAKSYNPEGTCFATVIENAVRQGTKSCTRTNRSSTDSLGGKPLGLYHCLDHPSPDGARRCRSASGVHVPDIHSSKPRSTFECTSRMSQATSRYHRALRGSMVVATLPELVAYPEYEKRKHADCVTSA